MSYTTIQQATVDTALNNRVIAAIQKEAHSGGAQFADSDFGRAARQSPYSAVNYMIWPVAIEYEADYAYAVESGNENPGGDPGVIGDDEIQASVQTNWPPDPWTPGA